LSDFFLTTNTHLTTTLHDNPAKLVLECHHSGFYWSKDESGGDSWSYQTCKALVKSPPSNQHQLFYRPDALPVTQPTVSAVKEENKICLLLGI